MTHAILTAFHKTLQKHKCNKEQINTATAALRSMQDERCRIVLGWSEVPVGDHTDDVNVALRGGTAVFLEFVGRRRRAAFIRLSGVESTLIERSTQLMRLAVDLHQFLRSKHLLSLE